jgi:transcriptional regulator of arginine metabolism
MIEKAARQRWIRRLLQDERISSQDELRQRLRARGVRAQQATLSRDLRELGVVKGPGGYAMPSAANGSLPGSPDSLERIAREIIDEIDRGGTLVVLRTGPGRAQALALAIDHARLDGLMGTVAGDDTVFLAARSPAAASRLARRFKSLIGER